jgi:hypothetical protein
MDGLELVLLLDFLHVWLWSGHAADLLQALGWLQRLTGIWAMSSNIKFETLNNVLRSQGRTRVWSFNKHIAKRGSSRGTNMHI